MFDSRVRALSWSTGLISSGVVLLLFNFGMFAAYSPLAQWILAGALVFAALVLFAGFVRNPDEWWRVIPAWTLLALAVMVLVALVPGIDQRMQAAAICAGLALAFGHIYLLNRTERWWALIPGGFMLVLGVVIAVSVWLASITLLAAILFAGLGGVFILLYLADRGRRQWWALIPGGVLIVFAVLAATAGGDGTHPLLRWWPVLLILFGLLVGLRTRRTVPTPKLEIHNARRPKPRKETPTAAGPRTARDALGDYSQPAPGATVEVLPDNEE